MSTWANGWMNECIPEIMDELRLCIEVDQGECLISGVRPGPSSNQFILSSPPSSLVLSYLSLTSPTESTVSSKNHQQVSLLTPGLVLKYKQLFKQLYYFDLNGLFPYLNIIVLVT